MNDIIQEHGCMGMDYDRSRALRERFNSSEELSWHACSRYQYGRHLGVPADRRRGEVT